MKRAILCYWLVLLCLLFAGDLWAANDTTRIEKRSPDRYSPASFRSFVNNKISKPSVFRPQLVRSLPQLATPNALQEAEVKSQQVFDQRYRQIIQAIDSNKVKEANAIHALHNFVKNNDALVKSLNINAPIQLPVGIQRVIGGTEYIVLVDSITLDSEGNATLGTYMSLTTPQGNKFAFKGTMTVSSEGGLVGEARLELMVDIPIEFAKGVLLNIKPGGTYVTVDCDGFKEMGLQGELTFAGLVRDSTDGVPGNEPIVTSFATKVSSWNDLVVQVNMPDFQIRGVKGLGFRIEDAVLDFSDRRNALNFRLPDIYDATWLPDGDPNSPLWQGFYVRSFKVALPPYLKTKEGETTNTEQIKNRITILGNDLVIDETGFTGKVSVNNLITRRQGNMDGFPFSIDHLGFEFRANELTKFEFNGTIALPVSEENADDYLTYQASLDFANDQFVLSAGITKEMKMPMFGGKSTMTLSQAFLEVTIAQGKAKPRAILSGHFTIANKVLNIEKIGFEGIEVTNKGIDKFDKIDVTFGKKEAGKFPVQITRLALLSKDKLPASDPDPNEINRVGIQLDLQVNFTKDIAATGFVTLITNRVEESNGKKRWKYKETQFDGMEIDVDQGPYLFKGSLRFFKEDADYGNGFNGNLQLGISLGGDVGFGLRATAIFGNINGMRYFYADALVAFSPGIPLGPTGIALYGFGGGIYYKMRKVKAYETNVGSDYGKTAAGDIYIPDANTSIGVKATTVIGLPSSLKPFQGEVTFEMAFNNKGGINYVGFAGYGYFLSTSMGTSTKTLAKAPEDKMNDFPLSAKLTIDFDVPNKTLHLVAGVRVNIEESGAKITGGGEMIMHFSPQDWYVYLGTPENRIGVEVDIPGVVKMNTGLYLMTGTKILAAPPLPAKVQQILGSNAEAIDSRYAGDLSKGAAFALGFDLEVSKRFDAFVYLDAVLGLGFDVEFRKYKDNVRCKGSSEPIGINGWFGQGKAYMYATGGLGIKFKGKDYAIAQLEAAIKADMQFFNPTWAKAKMAGSFNILGGLVKGDFKLDVEFGKHCTLESVGPDPSPVTDMQVISDVSPNGTEGAVDVFTSPQVAFNMAVETEFNLLDDEGNPLAFRVRLEKFEVTKAGLKVKGQTKWSQGKDVLVFQPHDILAPQTQYEILVRIYFEEKIKGVWTKVSNAGQTVTEERKVTFTSGDAPTTVPLFNIASSYPVINQLHLHKGETSKGFIQLHQGQPYLFDLKQNPQWASQKIRWINSATKEVKETAFTYNAVEKRLEFDMANTNLKNATVYRLDIVNKPQTSSQQLDANVTNKVKKIVTKEGTLNFANKKISGTQKNYQEQSILDAQGIYFRTSKYSKLADKIKAMTVRPGLLATVGPYIDAMHSFFSGDELFDQVEISGITVTRRGYEYKIPPLVQVEAYFPGTNWFNQKLNPLIYSGYPFGNGIQITWRDSQQIGVPPNKAVSLYQSADKWMLNPQNPVYPNLTAPRLRFLYEVAYYAYWDMYNLKNKTAQAAANGVAITSRLRTLLGNSFPTMPYGDFPIRVKYKVPMGKNTSTTSILLKTKTRPGN